MLRALPENDDISPDAADEMTLIDDRLAVLDADKASCTEALAKTPANSFADVVGKLDVATRVLSGEGGLVHDMVRGGRNSGRLLTNTLVSRGLRSRTACDAGWAPQASGILQPEAAPVGG